MKSNAAIHRREVIEDCLATLGMTMQSEDYCGTTLRDVFETLKRMAEQEPVKRIEPTRDYAGEARVKARQRCRQGLPGAASVQTPAGLLECTATIQTWEGPKRGVREAWAASWTLDGQSISYAQLRFLGLVHKRRRRTNAEIMADSLAR